MNQRFPGRKVPPFKQRTGLSSAARDFPLVLPGNKKIVIYGGPYRDCPSGVFGVKMAAEIEFPCNVSIPTEDFSVPETKDVDAGLIKVLSHLLKESRIPVYVGCMGGTGRTGLFMAVLAKTFKLEAEAFNATGPVGYVRANYKSHAVETSEQKQWVDDYKVPTKAKFMAALIRARALFPGYPKPQDWM